MKNAVLYVHGKGGAADESLHYRPLFPRSDVIGLDYRTFSPWETGEEILSAVRDLKNRYESVTLVANSIGAFFCMNAPLDGLVDRAYFISPIVDMEKLIGAMMKQANVTEEELRSKGTVRTAFGEDLSWEYLRYVRSHPISWHIPTYILYGGRDSLTDFDTVNGFALRHGADLTVMENGEHWFHTDEQLRFLDSWIRDSVPEPETDGPVLIDISQQVLTCEVYPGDPAPEFTPLRRMADGEEYNLSALTMCVHNGTHVDAPFHFFPLGKTVDQLPLECFVGNCFLARCSGDISDMDAADILRRARSAGAEERLLIAGNATVTPGAARVFSASGLRLLGCEGQSVGPAEAPMEVHLILLGAEVALLEGAVLTGLCEGKYFLSAAPLSVSGSDGAPCRAWLMKL